MKKHIESEPQLWSLSKSSVRKITVKYLKYSYKKATNLHKKWLTAESIRKTWESAYIQLIMPHKGFELIYLDEFSVNSRNNNYYNWSPIGSKSYITSDLQPFSMSFIIAFSRERVYGIMGSKSAVNSEVFLKFLKSLVKSRCTFGGESNFKFWIVCDNASIHTSREVESAIKRTAVKMITIAPYSPCLNPCEKVIGAIKSKIRRAIEDGRYYFVSVVVIISSLYL